jgi:hypothetical protein
MSSPPDVSTFRSANVQDIKRIAFYLPTAIPSDPPNMRKIATARISLRRFGLAQNLAHFDA